MKIFNQINDLLSAEDAGTGAALLRLIIIIALTVVAVCIINVIFKRVEKKRRAQGRKFGYVRILRYALLVAVFATAVTTAISGSAEQTIGALIASSGVVAVVISIACQEPLGNICSGIIIILASPFKVGDIIRHVGNDVLGTVEEITLRHTVIRTFENKRMFIPNSDMNRAAIENSNYGRGRIRIPLEFVITYESDIDVAIKVIENAILRHPEFDDEQAEKDRAVGKAPVEVLVNRFEPSGIVLKVWVWALSFSTHTRMKSDILREVHKHFNYAHITIAAPRMELVDPERNKARH